VGEDNPILYGWLGTMWEELEMYKSVREEVKAVEIYLGVYINIIFDTMKKLRLDNMCKKGINIYIQRQITLAHKQDLLR